MFASRMIGVPHDKDKPRVDVELPRGWINFEEHPFRQVDVGCNMLTYVAALSEYEATQINNRYRERVNAEHRKKLEDEGPNYHFEFLDLQLVRGAERVEEMLEAIRPNGYMKSWVIIESCTID